MNIKFVHPEALEALRSRFAITTSIGRWFRQMEPKITGITPVLILAINKIMLATETRTKLVAARGKRVFRRTAAKIPHITLGLCVSPIGDGRPPVVALPGPGPSRISNISKQLESFESSTGRTDG
jgi:hypothetical protein